MKDCGSCQYFIKWKADRFGGGLCDIQDARTKSDGGHNCDLWKGIKYKRRGLPYYIKQQRIIRSIEGR